MIKRFLKAGAILVLALLFLGGLWSVFNWKGPLVARASDADRLIIEPLAFGLEFNDASFDPSRAFEINGKEKVKEFLEIVEIDALQSGFHCMCEGDHRIRVFRGPELLLTLGHHHGTALRWHEGKWWGDARLTDDSQVALPAWFAKNGYSGLQAARDEKLRVDSKTSAEFDRFVNCFPAKAQEYFRRQESGSITAIGRDDQNLGKQIADAVGDGKSLTVAVSRAFGTLDPDHSSWSTAGKKERLANAAMRSVAHEDYIAALRTLKDDRKSLLGAARLFFWEDFIARFPKDAQSEWAVRLAAIVLSDGIDYNKPLVLRTLARINEPAIKAFLKDVMRGKVGKEIDIAKAFGQEPGLRSGAALSLAMLEDSSIKEEIRKLMAEVKSKQEIAALEVALALLGQAEFIKKEHFNFESYSIGYGALRAIERFNGAYGMDVLVESGVHHPWGAVQDEAVLTFERITGESLTEKLAKSPVAVILDGHLNSWWQVHGKDFVTQRRALRQVARP